MIPEIREKFNSQFDQQIYEALIRDINSSYRNSLVFRISETPLFLSREMSHMLAEAAHEVIAVLQRQDYQEKVAAAIPPGMKVAGETEHPAFLQVDFAICRNAQGDFIPQLIELQGFPSLYAFQHYLDTKIRQYFWIPEEYTPFFSGLDSDSYKRLLKKVLLNDSDPENVVLLDINPEQQKTRIDFYLTEEYFGIKAVSVTAVLHRGNKLYYKSKGREIPITRIYHRFIFDELLRQGLKANFKIDDQLDVTWVGHPNWFFKISKYTLPLIDSPYCPRCYYLKDLNDYPGDLEHYVLKPLFSFAGTGVEIDPTVEMLDAIPDRENYILQQKVEYVPLIKTFEEYSKAEVRMMFVWDEHPILVNNLVRMSKGKMMGVDYNKNKTWVGSTLAYYCG